MVTVVGLGEVHVDMDHLHTHELEAAALEAVDDLAHDAALDRVRLEEHEGSLEHVYSPDTTRNRGVLNRFGWPAGVRGWMP